MIDWIYIAFVLLLLAVINIGQVILASKIFRGFRNGEVDGDGILLALLILAFDILVIIILRRN